MFAKMRWQQSFKSAICGTLMAAFVGGVLAPTASAAEGERKFFTPEQEQELHTIIHDYLVSHPEVLVDAAKAFEAQQLDAQEQALTEVIDYLRNDDFTPVRGDRKAPHYLIEFFDYNCGYCKVVRSLTKKLQDEYDLVTIYVEFPILSALSARAAAIGLAMYSQSPEKYLQYQDILMQINTRITDEEQIKDAVAKVGGNYDELSELVNSDKRIQTALRKNMELGQKIGVQGTPFFILDGTVIRGAVKEYSTFEDIIKASSAINY